MNEIVSNVAGSLGLAPATMAILMIVILMACDKIAKAIPDDSTGWRKMVKLIARIIAVDVSNKLTAGTSIRDVAKIVLETPAVQAQLEVPPDTQQGTLDLTDAERIRKFPPPGSGTLGVILAMAIMIPLLSGCAALGSVGTGARVACQNRDAALALVLALGNDKSSEYAIRVYRYVNAICPVLVDDINKGAIPGLAPIPLGVLPPPPPGLLH